MAIERKFQGRLQQQSYHGWAKTMIFSENKTKLNKKKKFLAF